MKHICVVGAGKWGTNHISTLCELGVKTGIAEKNKLNKVNINKLFPGPCLPGPHINFTLF